MKRIIVALVCALSLVATAAAAEGYYDEDGSYVLTDGGNIFYQAHVQNYGDMPARWDGRESGTTGESRRLEAVRIYGAPVTFRVHVQGIGWTDWTEDGWAGTKGRSLRTEAIQVRMIDSPSVDEAYRVEYRVHMQNIGWMPWVADGATAGKVGQGLRLEAVEVRLVREPTD